MLHGIIAKPLIKHYRFTDLRVVINKKRRPERREPEKNYSTPWPLHNKIDVDFDGETIQTWDQVGNIHCTLRKSNIKYL